MKKLLLLPLLVLLAACSPSTLMEKFSDPEKIKVAREYLQRLMDGDVTLAGELEPKLRTGNEVELLRNMHAMIPPGAPASSELIGYQVSRFSEETNYNVTFQFRYGDRWVVANAAWREKPDQTRELTGMRVTPLDRSLQETNAFSFAGAGATHHLFFSAVTLIPLFTLGTLVVCIRTRFPRWKWMWIIFVLVGFGRFGLNWTTGETDVSLLSFQLFGASAMAASMYSPWIISFSVPVGAIAFWFKRRELLKTLPPIPPATIKEQDGIMP